jgi:hypothetical protein
MSTPRATHMRIRFPNDTKLSRAAAIRCFQIPSRRMREASCHPIVPLRDRWGKLDAHSAYPGFERRVSPYCHLPGVPMNE